MERKPWLTAPYSVLSGSEVGNITSNGDCGPIMKEIDDTDPPKNESEPTVEEVLAAIAATMATFRVRIVALEAEIADLHHRRRVSRQQATDQDPEWH